VDDGIQAVRRILPDCWFHPKAKQGLDALRNYRRDYDEKRNVYYDKPMHDWASHCFVGETEVLTRNGMYQIMNLPYSGEVLTKCGWKAYRNPRITQRNAQLVEVMFASGYSVKCTPEHLFLTESGWKSAESLTKGMRIQSPLTGLHSILTAVYIVCGLTKDILQEAAKGFTEKFGGSRLVTFLKGVIYTTKTAIQKTINFQTWNAFQPQNIYQLPGSIPKGIKKNIFLTRQEKKQQNGINLKLAGFGTRDTQKDLKAGQNGSGNLNHVVFAEKSLTPLSEKVAMLRNIVTLIAKQPVIDKVRVLNQNSDVWCLTVPSEESFTLKNGAIVHNCSDAFRYLAVGMSQNSSWSKPLPQNIKWIV
jgi:hypothetical protein